MKLNKHRNIIQVNLQNKTLQSNDENCKQKHCLSEYMCLGREEGLHEEDIQRKLLILRKPPKSLAIQKWSKK